MLEGNFSRANSPEKSFVRTIQWKMSKTYPVENSWEKTLDNYFKDSWENSLKKSPGNSIKKFLNNFLEYSVGNSLEESLGNSLWKSLRQSLQDFSLHSLNVSLSLSPSVCLSLSLFFFFWIPWRSSLEISSQNYLRTSPGTPSETSLKTSFEIRLHFF